MFFWNFVSLLIGIIGRNFDYVVNILVPYKFIDSQFHFDVSLARLLVFFLQVQL